MILFFFTDEAVFFFQGKAQLDSVDPTSRHHMVNRWHFSAVYSGLFLFVSLKFYLVKYSLVKRSKLKIFSITEEVVLDKK